MRSIFQPLFTVGLSIVLSSLLAYGCAQSTTTQRPQAVDLYVAGVNAYQSGDITKARQQFEWATTANPRLRMARSMLGDIYRSEGNYPAARKHYEILTSIDAYSAWNHYRLGITYQFLQMFKEAAGAYLKALNLKPDDWRTNMNLGLTYLSLDQPEEAMKYVEKANRLAPQEAEAWTNLGVVYDARGQYSQAEQAYRRALELDSQHSATMLNLGANLLSQNKTAEAMSVLEQAVARDANPLTLTQYADALAQARKFDQSLTQYDAAIALNNRYLPALNGKGEVLVRIYHERDLGLNDAARLAALESWKRSLSISPNQPRIQGLVQKWTDPKLFDE